jgi:hypothetical protein
VHRCLTAMHRFFVCHQVLIAAFYDDHGLRQVIVVFPMSSNAS